jgi:hypothetical protein
MSAALTEKHPEEAFPEQFKTVFWPFVQREEYSLLSQSQLDLDTMHCHDILRGLSMTEFCQTKQSQLINLPLKTQFTLDEAQYSEKESI